MVVLWAVIVSGDNSRYIAAAIGVGGAFSIGVVATFLYIAWNAQRARAKACMECEQSPTPIVIEESPPPTRSARLMSSSCHRRMNRSDRARRRGGRRRFGVHRRKVTLTFDPAVPDHCGFACILRAAGIKVNYANIEKLREQTADKMYKAYVNDDSVHGISIRDTVQHTEDTLAAYMAKLRWKLWASPAELCYAADVVNIAIAISVGHGLIIHGKDPRHIVRLMDQHYTLHVMRTPTMTPSSVPMSRGGMQSTSSSSTAWQWQHALPNAVSILSLPPASTVLEVREEIPEWALPARLS